MSIYLLACFPMDFKGRKGCPQNLGILMTREALGSKPLPQLRNALERRKQEII